MDDVIYTTHERENPNAVEVFAVHANPVFIEKTFGLSFHLQLIPEAKRSASAQCELYGAHPDRH